eukprot:2114284-Pleurochrysis_carterae.AAC.2
MLSLPQGRFFPNREGEEVYNYFRTPQVLRVVSRAFDGLQAFHSQLRSSASMVGVDAPAFTRTFRLCEYFGFAYVCADPSLGCARELRIPMPAPGSAVCRHHRVYFDSHIR